MKASYAQAALMFIAFAASLICGQPKSEIEFFDSTGSSSTAKFGWAGDATNGNFYIETPNDK